MIDLGTYHNRFAVRGTHYRAEAIAQIQTGADVCFEPEPTNPHDPKAIRVLVPMPGGPLHIGYVPRELCDTIHRLLEPNGPGIWNSRVLHIETTGPLVYVAFESGIPTGRQGSVGG